MTSWAAFLIGIFGGLHCLGMCGPLAAALPAGASRRGAYLAGRLLYNAGRVATYVALGAISGWLGHGLAFLGLQRGFSVAVGVLLIGLALSGAHLSSRLLTLPPLARAMALLKAALGRHLGMASAPGLLTVGLLNGLLPCGLVYVALAAAATTGRAPDGMRVMLCFGLGTLPVMLAASLAGQVVLRRVRLPLRRALPVALAVLAAMFIWRGTLGAGHCLAHAGAHGAPAGGAPECCEK